MELSNILREKNFKFNKAYGQNFISDTNLLKSIVNDACIVEEDTVIEIGCGAGTLTQELSKKAKKVIGYEIDENLKPVLAETLKSCENVEIRFKDILKEDMRCLDEERFKVVANLPYYITTPIIMRFLEESEHASSITVMVQKEVAERFVAESGTKEYGAISVMIKAFGKAKITRIVNRNMFYPVPNVDSAVVNILREEKDLGVPYKELQMAVKCGFSMRRKTILNCIASFYGIDKEKAKKVLEKSGIKESARGETLGLADYVMLAKTLSKN